MPKMTIYVPDDLQAEMTALEGNQDIKPNWSSVAQDAFKRECSLLTQRMKIAPTMRDAVDRLRRSKEREENAAKAAGDLAGRKWAAEEAEYSELVRLDRYVERNTSRGGVRIGDYEEVFKVLTGRNNINYVPEGDEELMCVEFWSRWTDDPIDDFVAAFVLGAREAWLTIEAHMVMG